MKVRATKVGFDGLKRRYPIGYPHKDAGQVFEISDDKFTEEDTKKAEFPKHRKVGDVKAFSDRWMEKVESDRPSQKSSQKPTVQKPTESSEVI